MRINAMIYDLNIIQFVSVVDLSGSYHQYFCRYTKDLVIKVETMNQGNCQHFQYHIKHPHQLTQ